MGQVMEPQVSDPELEEDEPPLAHIVRREDQMKGYIEGTPIIALCGKTWVPHKDWQDLEVCGRCKEQYIRLTAARSGNN